MGRDDDYASFVADMWAAEGISLNDVIVERGYSTSERTSGQLVSLVAGTLGRLYVNVLEHGVRKTYRPEMHRWWRDGQLIHLSAFEGVRLGADPDRVLRAESAARTLEDAISPEYNRYTCPEPSWVVSYREQKDGLMYVAVSKVLRKPHKFTARSHFRFGCREEFMHSGVERVVALATFEEEPLLQFLKGRQAGSEL